MDFYQKIIKAEDDLQLANITAETRVQNHIYVRKNPAPGQFSSVKAAIDSITTASQLNPFQVIIGPGVYVEDTITMKPWVFVRGNRNSTVIQVDDPSKDVLIASAFSEIHEVVLSGATDTGKAAVRVTNTAGGLFQIRECLFGSNDCFVIVDAPVYGQVTVLDSLVTSLSQFKTGFVLNGTGVCVGAFIGVNAIVGPSMSVDDFYLVETPTSVANISAGGVVVSGGTLTNGIRAYNGATIVGQAIAFMGATNAIVTDNTGAMPILQLGSTTVIGSTTTDLKLDHPITAGFVAGAFDTSKISIPSTAPISVTYTDPSANAGSGIVGSLLQGDSFDKITNISKLIRGTTPLGQFSGGNLSDGGGLTVDISLGNGFIEDGTEVVREVNWGAVAGLVVPASSSVVITVDSDGLIQAEATADNLKKIILGAVITDATGVVGLVDVPLDVNHHSNKIETTLTSGIGPIYVSGSISSEKNIGSRDITITSGTYYYGSRVVMPSGADPVTWTSFRQDGGGGFTTAPQSVVDNAQYDDGSGTLQAIPAGEFVKHSFYVVGTGATTSYFLVYGQQIFNSLSAAETGPLPTPPGFFNQLVVSVSSFIVEQGQSDIQTILDERPQVNRQASAVSPSSDHGNLSGLLDDDHPQYFRTDGTRVATGDFNMGTNDITNAGTYNSVDIENHKNRHLPNGLDPLDTGTAVTLGANSTNQEGIQNSLARSDHSHDINTGVVSTVTPDLANAEGVSNNLARADHIHNIPAESAVGLDADSTSTEGTNASFSRSDHTHDLATGNVSTLNPDQANAEGSSANLARADHIHNVPADTAVSLDAASVSAEGNSTSFARANHTHSIGTALVGDLTTVEAGDAAAAGTSNDFSRGDHQHAVATGTPSTQTPDQVNAEGSSTSLARADHVHNIPADVPGSIQPDDAADEGTASSFSRSDHTHAIVADAPAANLTATTTNGEGVATSFSRSDHSHNISTGVVSTQIPDQANAEGSSTNLARADHIHNIAAEAPSTNLDGDTTNTEGTSSSFSRADHIHALETGTPSTLNPDQANAEGSAAELARADHIHNVPAAAAIDLNASSTSAEGASTSFARSDHTHAIGTALVGEVTSIDAGDAADAGSSNNYSRGDHQHAVNTAVPVTINPDQGNAEGVSTNLARADHVHNIPADAPDTTLSPATVDAEGAASSFARSNHTHAIATAPVGQITTILAGDTPDAGTNDTFARGDHNHGVSTAAPSSLTPDQTNAEGVSVSLSRADHIHNIPAASAVGINADSTNTEGSSNSFARADHTHDPETGAAVTISLSTTNTEGTSTAFARADHTHNIDLSFAVPVTLNPDQANAEGVSADVARADHVHNVPADVAVGLDADSTNAEGTGSSFARNDHTHDLATGTVIGQVPSQPNAEGTSANLARADHVHNIPTATAVGLTATTTNSEGGGAFFARSTHTHAIASAAPITQTPDLANAVGTSTSFARADHVHNIPAASAVELTDSTNAEGVAASFARSDHTHSHGNRGGGTLHAAATNAVNGFMSAADKTKIDLLFLNECFWSADQFENPVNADWAVNALAPAAVDSNNAGLVSRLFDDTAEEGVGFSAYIPVGATSVTIRLLSRAETAPPAARTVGLTLYERGITGAVDAWSAGTTLTDIGIDADESWNEDSQTITLATLGLTAGQVHQFQLTRVDPQAGTELVGDWALQWLRLEFN